MIRIVKADAIRFLSRPPAGSIDLVFGSPPYSDARNYLENGKHVGIARSTFYWVSWMADVYLAANYACKGLVAFVVGGRTKNYRWCAAPALLMAELDRRGLNLRNPPIFYRSGIAGSGGPDWLRSNYEWIVCTSRPGRLPWSDNTACGKPPKYAPGGQMSHRASGMAASDGRVNDVRKNRAYKPPAIANPGNVIQLAVGGGRMGGDEFASQNEAPFPEKLAAFFIRSFCPPGGRVCDPFGGSFTTAAVAKMLGRDFVGCDIRQSQVDLGRRRLRTIKPNQGLET